MSPFFWKDKGGNMEIYITVYDDEDNVVKRCRAEYTDIRFGQIASIMELMNIEKVEDNMELMRVVYKAWKQLVRILSKSFPDMGDDDWDNVKIAELLPAIVEILKLSFMEMKKIPKSKNA